MEKIKQVERLRFAELLTNKSALEQRYKEEVRDKTQVDVWGKNV